MLDGFKMYCKLRDKKPKGIKAIGINQIRYLAAWKIACTAYYTWAKENK